MEELSYRLINRAGFFADDTCFLAYCDREIGIL